MCFCSWKALASVVLTKARAHPLFDSFLGHLIMRFKDDSQLLVRFSAISAVDLSFTGPLSEPAPRSESDETCDS